MYVESWFRELLTWALEIGHKNGENGRGGNMAYGVRGLALAREAPKDKRARRLVLLNLSAPPGLSLSLSRLLRAESRVL